MEPQAELAQQLDGTPDPSLGGEPKKQGDGSRTAPQSQFSALSGKSELFTLRVWREALGNGQIEWRGRIQHVLSGQVYYFRNWQALIDRLSGILSTEISTEEQLDSGIGEAARGGNP
jgi:hypothetical protein